MIDFLGISPEAAYVLGQIFGIVGMLLAMISFQFKKLTPYCLLQCLSGAAFTANFIFLGDPVSAVLNVFNILRGLAFGYAPEKSKKYFLVLLYILYTGAAVITFDPEVKSLWLTAVITVAQLVGSTVVFIGNGKLIRIVQLAYISPAWMINNIISESIGGILCETFNIISSIIALIRFRKDWFGKESDKQPDSVEN